MPGLKRKIIIESASINTPYLTALNIIEFKLFCAAYKYVQMAMGNELPQLQANNSHAGIDNSKPKTLMSKNSLKMYNVQNTSKEINQRFEK